MKRRGEILDTLVFLIVAVLLPAWLLGHLYLACYPAASSGSTTTDKTPTSLTLDDDSANGPTVDSTENSGDGSGSKSGDGSESKHFADASSGSSDGSDSKSAMALAAVQEKFDALSTKFQSQVSEGQALQDQVAQMQAGKAESDRMIGDLKLQLADANTKMQEAAKMQQPAATGISDEEMSQMKMDLAATTKQNTEYGNQLMQMQKELESARLKISDMESAPQPESNEKVMTEKISKLEMQIGELNNKLSSTNQTLALKDSELQRLRTEAAAMAAKPVAPQGELKVTPRQPAELVYRDFVSDQGKIAKLAFVRWDGEKVVVRSFADKRLYRLPLSTFSATDQEYLQRQK